jgi:sigma-B regulation protein RsbU (phosphoserine phosphatase)
MNRAIEAQLLERRRRVQEAEALATRGTPGLQLLLDEIDGALDRIAHGSFGLCETCHDSIETDRLLQDPLTRFCLDHLTPVEQRALQQDLDLAARIQNGLLPRTEQRLGIWHVAHAYRPAGPVSGDYCDVVTGADGGAWFMLGDVSGKGVSASMLMVHLHAMFRTLIPIGLPLSAMFERASALFCQSTLASHYATLVCVQARGNGEVEIANAGHPPALISGRDGLRTIDATGLPLGLFSAEAFSVNRQQVAPGETVLLYSDGLIEARNQDGEEFGLARLTETVRRHGAIGAAKLLEECLAGLSTFCNGAPPQDDLSVLAVTRVA